jgi:hypothetical protein
MKTPDTTNAVSSATRQGAQIIAPGGLPAKLNTVTAEVLARLLHYERLTSLDAVDEASTTRLSAVTFYLAEKYGWPIQTQDKATGCRDGRVAWVAEYFLEPEIVARALAAGADSWCTKVRTARRRSKAHCGPFQRCAQEPPPSSGAARFV